MQSDLVVATVVLEVVVLFCSRLHNVSGCRTIADHFTGPVTEPAYCKIRIHCLGSLIWQGTHLPRDLYNGIYHVPTRTPFQWEYLDSFCCSCVADKLVSSQRRQGHVSIFVQYTLGYAHLTSLHVFISQIIFVSTMLLPHQSCPCKSLARSMMKPAYGITYTRRSHTVFWFVHIYWYDCQNIKSPTNTWRSPISCE